jgi:hypothetical protein
MLKFPESHSFLILMIVTFCVIVCLSIRGIHFGAVIRRPKDQVYEDFQDEVYEDSDLFFSKQRGKCH